MLLILASLFSCKEAKEESNFEQTQYSVNQSSTIYELPGKYWVQIGIAGESDAHFRARIEDERITPEVMENGKILVYYKGAGKWEPLPYTRHRGSYHFTMKYLPGSGYIDILRYDSDQIPVSNSANEGEYRIVVTDAQGLEKVVDKALAWEN